MSPAAGQPGRDLPFAFDENEIDWQFVRSSGPGGQNVNKVATACRLRVNIVASASIPEAVKRRLGTLFPTRITADGDLIVAAESERSQHANRIEALNRFYDLLAAAAKKPKVRRPTKPTLASKRRRLEAKKQRAEIKQQRRSPPRPGE